ncbi:MAG: type IV-A pilus assembly ATPase PilB [Rhodocyclaceae bacterium]|nr:type IV-A pilus assembly ATPase PilB [Rhodocyclaceae bacterium]
MRGSGQSRQDGGMYSHAPTTPPSTAGQPPATAHLPPSRTPLTALVTEPAAAGLFDPRWLRDGVCVPLSVRDGVLRLALADADRHDLLEAIRFGTGHLLEVLPAEAAAIATASAALLERLTAESRNRDEAAMGIDALADAATPGAVAGDADTSDAPVVRYLHGLLEEAVRDGVSDIHFEPYELVYRVRFRRDGVLHEARQPPVAVRERLASRIKVMARLDIAERRRPQDGRIRLPLDGLGVVDMRVSVLPTLFGEKVVLRLMPSDTGTLDIDRLGLEAAQKAALLEAIDRPDGMVLVTGPTGSGKTMTLYTLLARLNRAGENISSAEDPAEMHLPGINQVNVNERTGLGFAAVLRAFLRQDPDTLMVGEIRDLETADIAIKAAQTGHRVLSTLHTRDAPGTLARLMSMGVAPFQLASAVRIITAQRLVRRLCGQCRRPDAQAASRLQNADVVGPALITASEVDRVAPFTADGCSACGGTGFSGRVGVHQVLPVSDAMNALILQQASARELARQAQSEGVMTLREAALAKVLAGVTSLAEAESVCHA